MQEASFHELLDIEEIIAKRSEMELADGSSVKMNVFQVDSYGNIKMDMDKLNELTKDAINADKVIVNIPFVSGYGLGEAPVYEIGEGYIKVLREGNRKSFVNKIGGASFAGKQFLEQGGQIIYVTERCVFELTGGGLLLTEIAPGINIQKDILDQMEFIPLFSEDLKQMSVDVFYRYSR